MISMSKPGIPQRKAATQNLSFIPSNTEKKLNGNIVYPEKSISLIYHPIIKIYRFFGVCPMTICNTNAGHFSYKFSLLSLINLFSVFICTLITCLYIDVILNSRFSTYYGKSNFTSYNFPDINETTSKTGCRSSLLPLFSRIIPLQLPINTSLNLFVSLISIPNFTRLLQMWSQFELDYQTKLNTPKSPYVKLESSRNKLAFIYVLFSVSHFTLINFAKASRTVDIETWNTGLMVASVLMIVPYIGYAFMEDFKFVFMFRTVEQGFREVSERIREFTQSSDITEEDESVNLAMNVSKWHELLLDLRQQTEMVSKCSSFHHLVIICNTFLALVVGVYFSVAFQFTAAVDKEKRSMAYATVGFCLVGLFRCLIKTNGSERIMNTEKSIVHTLNSVKTGDDLKTQMKINSLVDLIGRDPAQITILNCCKLNTSFILQVVGQIATYLIILLQFEKM